MPKKNFRSTRRIGRDLRVKLKEVEPHSRGSKMISKEIMLTLTHFLVPEVEEEAAEELSHVSHVERMGTSHSSVQRRRKMEEKLTSLKRRGMMLTMKTPEVGGH